MTIATPRPEPAADGPGSVTSLQSVEQVGDEVVTLAGALHLGRFTATSLGGQRFELHRDGRAWSAAAGPDGPAEHLGHEGVRPDAAVPDRHGEPLDVGYVTDVLRRSCSGRRPPGPGAAQARGTGYPSRDAPADTASLASATSSATTSAAGSTRARWWVWPAHSATAASSSSWAAAARTGPDARFRCG